MASCLVVHLSLDQAARVRSLARTLCCVLGQGTLSPTVPLNLARATWTSTPSRGSKTTPSHFKLKEISISSVMILMTSRNDKSSTNSTQL